MGMNWCVEDERNYSFEVAIRTSFFDDDAESLGKKRLVADEVGSLIRFYRADLYALGYTR